MLLKCYSCYVFFVYELVLSRILKYSVKRVLFKRKDDIAKPLLMFLGYFFWFLAICRKINNTTSGDWEEGHLFQDRRNLQMFVSYCSASPICFKIGRITFTSTLAWFSFFFGSTGLLFHFFSSK